jgi:hypothetical protein
MASEVGEGKYSSYIWIFLILFLSVILLTWGVGKWQRHLLRENREKYAFFRVTNREFSLFLWQHPEFLQSQVQIKEDYLPHFAVHETARLLPEYADAFVIAPPELLFRYHVWKRLLGDTLAPRPIDAHVLSQFLDLNKEWLPKYWKEAPAEYAAFVQKLPLMGQKNVQDLPYQELPFEVRFAFQGWYNYYHEWSRIQNIHPSIEGMGEFLVQHPRYGRSHWRNILKDALPNYLITFKWGGGKWQDQKGTLAHEELSDFLRIGYFNFVVQK